MSEFQKVSTKADLETLDEGEMVAGYLAGISGETAEPGSDKSRSYWHGWRNAMSDRGHSSIDAEQSMLCRELVGTYRGFN